MNALPSEQMIQKQIIARGIRDPSVLNALRTIDRKQFVPGAYQHRAYEDCPLPLSDGQTISQPYIVALMTTELASSPRHTVLEIGTGSGYQTAILATISKSVTSLERIETLYKSAKQRLAAFHFSNLEVILTDGKEGWKAGAPYERIILTAAPEKLPATLWNQLAENGIMIAPIGPAGNQTLFKIRKVHGNPIMSAICAVRFVPLL